MSDKQRDKLINEYNNICRKLEVSLNQLKENIIKLEDGDDKEHSYWNGPNAYDTIKNLYTTVDNGFALCEYLDECEESIK